MRGCRWSHLTVLLSCLFRALEALSLAAINVTVDDTHPSISYFPPSAWSTTSKLCPGCSAIAHNSSFHLFGDDEDKQARAAIPPPLALVEEALHPVEELGHSYSTRRLQKRKWSSTSKLTREPSLSGSMKFEFIGSAIYLFGLESSHRLQSTNTDFSLDGVTYPRHLPSSPPSSSMSQAIATAPLFSKEGLTDGPHVLTVTLGADSSLIFDYLIYTRSIGAHALIALPPSTPSSGSLPAASTPSDSSPDKKRNITTFAAAVGGSVGVLALLSFALAISIMRRRFRARKRERKDRNAIQNDPERMRQAQMTMAGSETFIPRFFPGTEIHPRERDPPPYQDTVLRRSSAGEVAHTDDHRGRGSRRPLNFNLDGLDGALAPSTRSTLGGSGSPSPTNDTGLILPNHISYPYPLSMHPQMQQNHPYLHPAHTPPHHMHGHGHGILGLPNSNPLSYADVPPDSPPPLSDLALSDDEVGHGGHHDRDQHRHGNLTPPPPFPQSTLQRATISRPASANADLGTRGAVGEASDDEPIPFHPPALGYDDPEPQAWRDDCHQDGLDRTTPTTMANSHEPPADSAPLLNSAPRSSSPARSILTGLPRSASR